MEWSKQDIQQKIDNKNKEIDEAYNIVNQSEKYAKILKCYEEIDVLKEYLEKSRPLPTEREKK